jgi:hypothetical protein
VTGALAQLSGQLSDAIAGYPVPERLACPLCSGRPFVVDAQSSKFVSDSQKNFVRWTMRCACGANIKIEVTMSDRRQCAHAIADMPAPIGVYAGDGHPAVRLRESTDYVGPGEPKVRTYEPEEEVDEP